MTMTTKELLALVGKATPGPWSWHGGELLSPTDFVLCATNSGQPRTANRALIVAAVNALPALCAEVEALRKDAERYRWLRDTYWLPDSDKLLALTAETLAERIDADMAAKEPK